MTFRCAFCDKPGCELACGACGAPYCGEECQRMDWERGGHCDAPGSQLATKRPAVCTTLVAFP